ncbi:hypothetical protein CsSME_00038670 [Camellia sinensis var. sinensis]
MRAAAKLELIRVKGFLKFLFFNKDMSAKIMISAEILKTDVLEKRSDIGSITSEYRAKFDQTISQKQTISLSGGLALKPNKDMRFQF